MNELQTVSTELQEQPSHGPLTVEQGYERLQESKDVFPEPKAPKVEHEVSPEVEEPATEEGLWSTEDVQVMNLFQQHAAQFHNDLAVYAQAKSIDLNELEKQDRAQAVAFRQQLSETERQLRGRYQVLSEAANELNAKAEAKAAAKVHKHLKTEWNKLKSAVPDLDRGSLRTYLKGVGFTEKEIASAADHRLLVLAEKARKWDASQKGVQKVPKYRKGAKPKQQTAPKESPEVTAAFDRANTWGLTRQDAGTILRANPTKKGPANVGELTKRLKQTGSIEDAYQLLKAKKRSA